ncbi:hypothetical protein KY285_035824, partial [Solanum tuberosum]
VAGVNIALLVPSASENAFSLITLLKLPHCGKNRGHAFSYVSKRVQLCSAHFSRDKGARPIGPVHVFLNVALPPTSPSFCSWDPCKRPTTIDAFRHPLFQSCFYIPPSVRTKAAIAKTPHSVEQKYKWSFGLLHNPKPSINFSTVKS